MSMTCTEFLLEIDSVSSLSELYALVGAVSGKELISFTAAIILMEGILLMLWSN